MENSIILTRNLTVTRKVPRNLTITDHFEKHRTETKTVSLNVILNSTKYLSYIPVS